MQLFLSWEEKQESNKGNISKAATLLVIHTETARYRPRRTQRHAHRPQFRKGVLNTVWPRETAARLHCAVNEGVRPEECTYSGACFVFFLATDVTLCKYPCLLCLGAATTWTARERRGERERRAKQFCCRHTLSRIFFDLGD